MTLSLVVNKINEHVNNAKEEAKSGELTSKSFEEMSESVTGVARRSIRILTAFSKSSN